MKERIKAALTASLQATHIEVIDDSDKHLGHDGSVPGGETHFTVLVVSDMFKDKTKVERHRLVYGAINNEFSRSLHALVIQPFTKEEYRSKCS